MHWNPHRAAHMIPRSRGSLRCSTALLHHSTGSLPRSTGPAAAPQAPPPLHGPAPPLHGPLHGLAPPLHGLAPPLHGLAPPLHELAPRARSAIGPRFPAPPAAPSLRGLAPRSMDRWIARLNRLTVRQHDDDLEGRPISRRLQAANERNVEVDERIALADPRARAALHRVRVRDDTEVGW